MSGVNAHVFGHLVRRGVAVAQQQLSGVSPEYVAQLQYDAELYENAGPEMEINPTEFLPVLITGLLALFVIATIRYTIGEVISSLAMIESPSSIAIIEDKPPAYADEPDAPLSKEPLLPSEAEADVEVTLIPNKPITSSIRTSVRHLDSVGGFLSRWRGMVPSVAYHMLHALLTNICVAILGGGLVSFFFVYVWASLLLVRFHMAWTHAMIAHPSSKSLYQRIVSTQHDIKVLAFPSLVYAVAQQLTLVVPVALAVFLKESNFELHHTRDMNCGKLAFVALGIIAVPVSIILLSLFVLLPAAVTLTRIEAALLPDDEQTIVPFDREAILGDVDLSVRGGYYAVFRQAWASISRETRWRLVKLYVKMILIEGFFAFVYLALMVSEMQLIGGERLQVFMKSAVAQLQLMAIDGQ